MTGFSTNPSWNYSSPSCSWAAGKLHWADQHKSPTVCTQAQSAWRATKYGPLGQKIKQKYLQIFPISRTQVYPWTFESANHTEYFLILAIVQGVLGGSKVNYFPWNDPWSLLHLGEVAIWVQPRPKYEHIPSTKEHINNIINVIFTMNS